MKLKIRKMPSRGPGQPVEFASEKVFLRDGNMLECPPLQPGEVVEVPDDEANALLMACGEVLESTDEPANRDFINESWQPTIPRSAVPGAPPQVVDEAARAENEALRGEVADLKAMVEKLTGPPPGPAAQRAAVPPPPAAPGVLGMAQPPRQ